MEITITCKDYEELTRFARTLLNGAGSSGQGAGNVPAAPAVPNVPVTPSTPVVPVAPAATAVPAQGFAVPAAPAAPTVPAAPAGPAPVQNAAVPTASASYTQDDLARAAVTLMDSGRQAELLQLLQGFGVASLPELPAARYGEFATALRTMGAPI